MNVGVTSTCPWPERVVELIAHLSTNVPDVDADQMPTCVYVPAGTSNVTCDPDEMPSEEPAVHVVCLRAYAGDPPDASLVPVEPGSAVCREIQVPRPVYAVARASFVALTAIANVGSSHKKSRPGRLTN